ncbi:MAG: M23 family metallopeptidase [bacterium]
MFKQFEIILTIVLMTLSTVFLFFIIWRLRSIFIKRKVRIPIWNKKVGILNRAAKLVLVVVLFLMVPGVIYFFFIVTLPTAVARPYAKTLFVIIFSAWSLLEIFLCASISEKLLKGSLFRRAVFSISVILCIAVNVYLFPVLIKSLPYPGEEECVILELPVRGTWLAGHAGASDITNGHLINRYAIDILKLGSDGRFFKFGEKSVTDFYSYNEPVYAPANGQVVQVVDSLESDVLGNQDIDNPGGNYVIFDIGDGKYVYFAHFKKGSIIVEKGQFLKTGEIIGRIGNSGYSTHPHLHMHVQNKATANREGRITYPFRFHKMFRKRVLFWIEIRNGYLLRNDIFCGSRSSQT